MKAPGGRPVRPSHCRAYAAPAVAPTVIPPHQSVERSFAGSFCASANQLIGPRSSVASRRINMLLRQLAAIPWYGLGRTFGLAWLDSTPGSPTIPWQPDNVPLLSPLFFFYFFFTANGADNFRKGPIHRHLHHRLTRRSENRSTLHRPRPQGKVSVPNPF